MGELQPTHLLLVLLVGLLLFGGSRVSALGKGLGEAIRNFKQGLRADQDPQDVEQKK
jgi:sec-independent protein translocase protein TatA